MANSVYADDYELCLCAQDPILGKHSCPLNTFHCSGVTLSISKHSAHSPHIWDMCEECLSCSADRGVKRDQRGNVQLEPLPCTVVGVVYSNSHNISMTCFFNLLHRSKLLQREDTEAQGIEWICPKLLSVCEYQSLDSNPVFLTTKPILFFLCLFLLSFPPNFSMQEKLPPI